MKVKVDFSGRTLIASLTGELDHHAAKDVKDTVENYIKNQDVINLVFDLSKLTFMDSSGIGVIIGRYKLINSIGGKVIIVSVSSSVDRLLTMSGIKRIIQIVNTKSDAIKILEEGTN